MQAERRRRGEVDVRRRSAIQSHAEHLADVARGDEFALRFADPVLARGALAGSAQIDNAADRSGGIDHDQGFAIRPRDRCGARKAGREGFAGSQQILLRERELRGYSAK